MQECSNQNAKISSSNGRIDSYTHTHTHTHTQNIIFVMTQVLPFHRRIMATLTEG